MKDPSRGVDEAPRVVRVEAAPPRALHTGALVAAEEALESIASLFDEIQLDGIQVLGGKPHLMIDPERQ